MPRGGPRPGSGRPPIWTDARKAEAIAVIENEYGGNVAVACKAMGWRPSGVRRWYDPKPDMPKGTHHGGRRSPMPDLPPASLIEKKRAQMTDIFEKIVLKYADYLSNFEMETDKSLKPNSAAVTLGILFDKLQIMQGMPTHITQTNVRYMAPGSLRHMAKERLRVLEGGRKDAEEGDPHGGDQSPPLAAGV